MKVAVAVLLVGLVPAFLWASRSGVKDGMSPGGGVPEVGAVSPVDAALAEPQSADQPVYVVYYWRARPGREAEYSAYIRDYAEPIDEEARRAGVFDEVHTYTPFLRTGAPGGDWTHMRVFKLKNFAALDGFSAGLDAATARAFPDPSRRPSSAEMRDLVRQEIWRDF
jgi:hypothetical protein